MPIRELSTILDFLVAAFGISSGSRRTFLYCLRDSFPRLRGHVCVSTTALRNREPGGKETARCRFVYVCTHNKVSPYPF